MQNLATRYVRVNRHLCILYETFSSLSLCGEIYILKNNSDLVYHLYMLSEVLLLLHHQEMHLPLNTFPHNLFTSILIFNIFLFQH